MAIVRIAGVEHIEILATANGFPHPGVQLARGRIGKDQLELGMLLDAHCAIGGAHPLFEVIATGEGVILETGTGEGGAGFDLWIEVRLHHEEVVVARVAVDVSCFALDQIAEHIVGDPGAERGDRCSGHLQRLVKHQGHGIVEMGGGGT